MAPADAAEAPAASQDDPASDSSDEPDIPEDEFAEDEEASEKPSESTDNDPSDALELRASDFLLIFPIAGRISYVDSWGAPRPGGRTHKGTDVFAEKGTPVVAAAAGKVIAAGVSDGTAGVYVKIRHGNGGVTVYLHLNNDTPGTDDGQAVGIANGIEKGVYVPAGKIIGYVGDSGNAETTPPHLHFEYRPDDETSVNPFPMLKSVQGPVTASSPQTRDTTLPFTGRDTSPLSMLALTLIIAGTLLLIRARSMKCVEDGRAPASIVTVSMRGPRPTPHQPAQGMMSLSTRQLTRAQQEP